jgi:hypothetical protein
MRANFASRGGTLAFPLSRRSASPARGPEMRTTPIAAGGRPDDNAKIVSWNIGGEPGL